MNDELFSKVKKALRLSWSSETCLIYQEQYPYYGQCAQTSIVIRDIFGGEILKTKGWLRGEEYGPHYYNFIDGERRDFTAEQFTEIPQYTRDLEYQDIPSSEAEAMTETNQYQVTALREAFSEVFGEV